MRKFLPHAVLLAAAISAVPNYANARVYVRVAPPAPVVETRIVSPGAGYIWVSGYYRWSGGKYVWVPGRWSRPPHHHRVWVAGHWAHHSHNGWYWVGGHWR